MLTFDTLDTRPDAHAERPAGAGLNHHYWMPFTAHQDFHQHPRMIQGAEGRYFIDDRGRRVFDSLSGLWTSGAGHNREEIREAVARQLGSLDRVKQVVKVTGMVNSAPGFERQWAVIDGASNFYVDVFGAQAGQHARSAIGGFTVTLSSPGIASDGGSLAGEPEGIAQVSHPCHDRLVGAYIIKIPKSGPAGTSQFYLCFLLA